jgi:5-(carboxyamino)imidazole ribonucleotide synthase
MFDKLKTGVLGGGQLGAMLLRYAVDFGIDVAILDKDDTSPCARYSGSFVAGDPMNYEDVINFGKNLDVITIEKESVNIAALKTLRNAGVRVYPSPETIELIQDKYVQKQYMKEYNIPVANGWLINKKADLQHHIPHLPACLKKCTSGYDGNGVMMLHTAADIANAFDEPSVLEELIDVKQEISVIVARNESGDIECYDPVLMMFDKVRMLLDFQICPAGLSPDVSMQVRSIAIKVAAAVNLTGIMAVEMFIAHNGDIYVNELAPRPHNSGHHTIEAAATSQYEQHLRLILGLPMGSTRTTLPSVMINVLEPAANNRTAMEAALSTILSISNVHLHWYGKEKGREGRKMGHITITGSTLDEAMSKSITIRHLLKESYA